MDDQDASAGLRQQMFEALGTREPSTVLEAQAVIEHIQKEKGYLDDATMQDVKKMPARSRQQVMGALEKKREIEAAFTKSISEQLYSSKYRFLYELVQNADDSRYEGCLQNGRAPYLRFRITPTKFIFETNEDGFTRANVEAICETGKSSKKASALDQHIGEKGFGFKSVFSIAQEVRVQSGVWSFAFKHKQGDDGLGMVTPLETDPETLPENVTTRITLTLSEAAIEEHNRLLQAVLEMPDTTIFFLQHLEMFEVIREGSGSLETRTTTTKSRSSHGKIQLVRTTEYPREKSSKYTEESTYAVFDDIVVGMPKDERRKGRVRAKVELAFPLDSNDQPKLSALGRHVFAYLPLQRIPQLRFLIQSDFIASASRESVIDCAWNGEIVKGTAQLFAKAIRTFATPSHPLLYSWLEFLPAQPMDGLWKNLYTHIKALIRELPVLQTWERREFKAPNELRRLKPWFLHDGQPLFRDLGKEIYLAPEYKTRHHALLDDLGTKWFSFGEAIERVSHDLVTVDSYIRSYPASDVWHEACAKFLLHLLEQIKHVPTIRRIKQLAIIPVGGGWTGAAGFSPGGLSEIYFPRTGNVEIPDDIGLKLVENTAASNAVRRQLFQKLGVKDCSKDTVLAKIEATQRNIQPGCSLKCSLHSKYLFHHHPEPDSLAEWMLIPCIDYIWPANSTLPFYLPGHREFDTKELLPRDCFTKPNAIARLISDHYANLIPDTIRPQELSWKEWIQGVIGARYHPPLLKSSARDKNGSGQLSPVLLAVLEHNPEIFVSLLKAHWSEYKLQVSRVRWQLIECKVPCISGGLKPLGTTYLPTVKVQSRLRDLRAENGFPLLKLPSLIDEATQDEWSFLETLKVRCNIDRHFYEIVLQQLTQTDDATVECATEVYNSIAEMSTLKDGDGLKTFFGSFKSIAVEREHGALQWIEPSKCVWNGPNFLTVVVPLEHHYGEQEHIPTLFKVLLGIRESSFEDICDELDWRRDSSKKWTTVDAAGVYQYLQDTIQTAMQWKAVREAFQSRSLIMGADGTWHTTQTCLWNSLFPLSGYEDVSTTYPSLKSFFVTHLKVKNATPAMLINELCTLAEAAQSQPRNIPDIRERLIQIGGILAKSKIDEPISSALEKLRQTTFLPRRASSGEMELLSVADEFAILDHERYGIAFADKSILLDFGLHEVHILNTVFQHMGLVSRYLSVAVNELSTVGEVQIESTDLTHSLQSKAYWLYCCAAKYKSTRALRGDTALFDQLSQVRVYRTNEISTNLVLACGGTQHSVQSDRLALHHEIVEGNLKLFVPDSQRQLESCFKLQIPKFFATFFGVSSEAELAISEILKAEPWSVNDVLMGLDIHRVSWIEQPEVADPPDAETLLASEDEETAEVFVTSARSADNRADTSSPEASRVYRGSPDASFPDLEDDPRYGDRSPATKAYHRRIGALGELHVVQTLECLNLPGFSRQENWQSTIRGEVRDQPGCADLQDWNGVETADIVYTDRNGTLTRWLTRRCTGGLPEAMQQDRDFAAFPIKYFLEVKSTPGACETRFFLGSKQYKMMEDLAVPEMGMPSFSTFDEVFVILRVYHVSTLNVATKIFVDPYRLRKSHLQFEFDTVHAMVRDHS